MYILILILSIVNKKIVNLPSYLNKVQFNEPMQLEYNIATGDIYIFLQLDFLYS